MWFFTTGPGLPGLHGHRENLASIRVVEKPAMTIEREGKQAKGPLMLEAINN